MPDDLSRHPENTDQPEIPASVTFMEMMRQAASRAAAANQPAYPEQPPMQEVLVASQVVADEAPTPAMTPEDRRRYAVAMDEERIRRVQRRKAKRRRQAVSTIGGLIRTFLVVIAAAGLMATIFTWFTPNQFIASSVRDELSIAQATSQPAAVRATVLPTPNWLRRIGVVSGHRGPENDPGAVCPDGLKEADINFSVAQTAVRNLRGLGYSVDLLDEFDPRLESYQAAALVSVHANTCQPWPGEVVSGFLIAAAAARVTARGNDNVLVECIAQYYLPATGLQRHDGLTIDMTDYHTFREIHPLTPAAIIELGFMLADRDILTQKTDVMAEAITNGILCFLEPRQLPATPTPASP
jgi:N-acetylmuramoyl-L-alanine amidase